MSKPNYTYIIKITLGIIVLSYLTDKAIYYSLNIVNDKILSGQSGGKLNHFLLVKDSVKVVILGNSRANHHVDPQKLSQSAFNMGADARSIAYCTALTKLLPENKEQTVIINVDTKNSFDADYSGEDVGSLRVMYHRNELLKTEIDKVYGYDIIQNFFWCKAYNGRVLGLFKNYFIPKYDYRNYYGYDPIHVDETQTEMFKNVLKYSKPVDCFNEYHLSPLYKLYIEEIKAFCEMNNKKLVMITTPLYNDECQIDNEQMVKVFKELGVEYHDFSNMFNSNNSMEYWKDEVHLSDAGAQIFSENLNKIIFK